MKTSLVVAGWLFGLALITGGRAQSSFGFLNYGRPLGQAAPVFDAEGRLLEGPVYVAELWGGVAPDSLRPAMDPFPGRARVIVPFHTGDRAGYFYGSEVIVSVPIVGGGAWLQVRAWDSRLGATYEEVAARGLGGFGGSPVFYAFGSRPYGLDAPAPLIGLESFRLLPVIPEPSTWALLGLGWLVVAWRVRRGSSR